MRAIGLSLSDQKVDRLKRYIDEAQSIEELCEILNLTRIIRSKNREISTLEIINQIREADALLANSWEQLVKGVIDQGPHYYRDALSRKVNKIINGDDLAIRHHVKDLLRRKMTEKFLENKKYFLEKEIAKARDFDSLCDILRRVQVIDFSRVAITDFLTITLKIQTIRDNLNFLIKDGNLTTGLDEVIEELSASIPGDLGLKNKVKHLMFETLKIHKLSGQKSEFSGNVKKIVNKFLAMFK